MQIDKRKVYEVDEYTFTNFVNLDDEQLKQIWEWRNDANIRKYMYNTDLIPLENHFRFVQSLNNRTDVAYWLVKKDGESIGVINFTDINYENSSAEIGFYMIPSKLNSGLGLEFAYNNILFVFDTTIQCETLHGSIHRSNINALVLDSYLGCKVKTEDLKDLNKTFIPFSVDRRTFLSGISGKKDMHSFVSYVKAHRKDFQV